MASDWIKMRTDIYRDPKVCMMADNLMQKDGDLAAYVDQNTQNQMNVTRNVMRNVTVGALVTVWGVTRHRGERDGDNLILRGCSLAVVDDIADMPGFGEAMASVGWAEESPQGVVFPRFFGEHNVDPTENSRSKNAERQKRFRERHATKSNVTDNVTVTHREEKSRVENITPLTPPAGGGGAQGGLIAEPEAEEPLPFDSVAFTEAWKHWEQHRREIRKPLKPTMREAQLRELEAMGEARAIAALRHTIAKGWQGIREPDQLQFGPQRPAERERPVVC